MLTQRTLLRSLVAAPPSPTDNGVRVANVGSGGTPTDHQRARHCKVRIDYLSNVPSSAAETTYRSPIFAGVCWCPLSTPLIGGDSWLTSPPSPCSCLILPEAASGSDRQPQAEMMVREIAAHSAQRVALLRTASQPTYVLFSGFFFLIYHFQILWCQHIGCTKQKKLPTAIMVQFVSIAGDSFGKNSAMQLGISLVEIYGCQEEPSHPEAALCKLPSDLRLVGLPAEVCRIGIDAVAPFQVPDEIGLPMLGCELLCRAL